MEIQNFIKKHFPEKRYGVMNSLNSQQQLTLLEVLKEAPPGESLRVARLESFFDSYNSGTLQTTSEYPIASIVATASTSGRKKAPEIVENSKLLKSISDYADSESGFASKYTDLEEHTSNLFTWMTNG